MMDNLERILKSLADKNRLRITWLLRKRKACVCELAHVLGVTQPSVSRHLKKMMRAGIVGCEQEHLWTNYYLKKDNRSLSMLILRMRHWLDKDSVCREDFMKLRNAGRLKFLLCRKKRGENGRKG